MNHSNQQPSPAVKAFTVCVLFIGVPLAVAALVLFPYAENRTTTTSQKMPSILSTITDPDESKSLTSKPSISATPITDVLRSDLEEAGKKLVDRNAKTAAKKATNEPDKTKPKTVYPYQFIDTKRETFGQNNIMDLYHYDGELKESEMIAFCNEKKSSSTAKSYYSIVIFDKKENADFPINPISAEFGLEDDRLKHIRMIYRFLRLNGHSSITYHPINIFQHKSIQIFP
jgi:hypothetical protein